MKSIVFAAIVALLSIDISLVANDEVLLTIANKEISKSEFERIYAKNQKIDILGQQKGVDEYLELFINYKLKVAEAESRGLDTLETFKKEFAGYTKQLAEPYLLDQSVDSAVVKEAYDRLLTDVRSSHILIQLRESASPEDTVAAYEKMLRIRERLLAGEDFEKVARATSDDQSAKDNGGDIGYSTAFSTVYPYENMLYRTDVGEISPIFRTQFGYHVLKVTEKKPSAGQVNAAHIMISVSRKTSTDAEWAVAKETIDSIYHKLQSGGDFANLAKQYSTDTKSAQNGGELGWIDNGMPLPGNFKYELYELKENGQYSKPFKTSFGYHIVKLIDQRPFQPFSEMEESIRKDVAKDPMRANKGRIALVEQLKSAYNFQLDEKGLEVFVSKVGDKIMRRKWVKPSPDSVSYPETIFTFADQVIIGEQFAVWLEANQKKMQKIYDVGFFVQQALEYYVSDRLINYEKSKLPSKNIEYRDLLTEYRDGMLLFEVSNQEVWKKANNDTVGLEAFYQSHKNNFMWGERLEVQLFYCKDEAAMALVKKLYVKFKKKGLSTKELVEKVNAKDASNVKVETKLYSKGENETIDALNWQVGEFKEFGKSMFVEVVAVKTPEPKALHETRGAVVADYQKYLEEMWIKTLRSKYEVKIDDSVLQAIKNNN